MQSKSTLQAMKEVPRWLLWKYGEPDAKGKRPKVPHNARTRFRCDPTNPDSWTTHDAAAAAVAGFDGLGFALGDGWQGIDFDAVDAHALADLVNAAPGYVEVSPSGMGAHAIGFGAQFPTLASNASGLEAYSGGQFFTVTGRAVRDPQPTDLAPFVAGVIAPRHSAGKAAPAATPAREQAGPLDAATMAQLADALTHISADHYGTWQPTLSQLKSIPDNGGFEMARLWSQRSTNYCGDAEFHRKWHNDIRADHTNWRAVFKTAQENGWKNPGWQQDVAHVNNPIAANNPFAGQGVPNPNRYKLLSGDELDNLPPVEWRVKDVFPKKGLCAIGGASRSGKSFLGFEMAMSIVNALDFFGHKTEPCDVVYVGLEGASGVPGRRKAWLQYHNRGAAGFGVVLQPFAFNSEQEVQDLAAICSKGSVVIIDTLARATPGMDENAPKDMGKIIAAATQLYELIDGLVILIHHTGKDEAKGFRGHSDFIGALDGAIIAFRDDRGRKFKIDKVKDGEDGKFFGFKLETVVIGKDADGDDITSCVVIPDELPLASENHGSKLSKGELFLQSLYWEAFAEARQYDYNCDKRGVPMELWRKVFFKKSHLENDASKRRTFNRDVKRLIEEGHFAVENDTAFPRLPQNPIKNGADSGGLG